MKYSIRFFNGSRHVFNADEIIIRYNKQTSGLIDFAQNLKQEQRLVVDITQLEYIENNLSIFKAAYEKHNNFAIMAYSTQYIVDIAEMNIPFFFINGVSSFDDLIGQINLGVSDVYILNEMGFYIEQISKVCHENNVLVRVYPNVAQSLSKFATEDIQKFFIRPDDIAFYEDYIDVMEFFGPLDKQDVLFEIYRDERWLGNLNDLIIGLDKEIDNKSIVPHFGQSRVKCQKRCTFGKCDVCGCIMSLANTLKDAGLGIKKEKAKHEFKFNEISMQNEPAAAVEDNA